MNIFLKGGNLIWVIDEINKPAVMDNRFSSNIKGITTQEVLMRLINPENLNRKSKESLKIDLGVPITCRGKLYFINDMIYYTTEDKGDLFYKLDVINPDAFLVAVGRPPFKVEKYVFNQELDEGFMPENVEDVLPTTGGGRKKRRKRRKTKKRKSKRKSKRSSKKRKSKKK